MPGSTGWHQPPGAALGMLLSAAVRRPLPARIGFLPSQSLLGQSQVVPLQQRLQVRDGPLLQNHRKSIAVQLGIAEATVKVQLKSLLRKVNASDRTQAAIWALNNGIGTDSPTIRQPGVAA